MKPICPYCGQSAKLVTGSDIYQRRPDLSRLNFWKCDPCVAWVGCHKGGDGKMPLGRLANAELRTAKSLAHAAFDPLWRQPGGEMSRREAYRWLGAVLGLEEAHIGEMTVAQCMATIEAVRARKRP